MSKCCPRACPNGGLEFVQSIKWCDCGKVVASSTRMDLGCTNYVAMLAGLANRFTHGIAPDVDLLPCQSQRALFVFQWCECHTQCVAIVQLSETMLQAILTPIINGTYGTVPCHFPTSLHHYFQQFLPLGCTGRSCPMTIGPVVGTHYAVSMTPD